MDNPASRPRTLDTEHKTLKDALDSAKATVEAKHSIHLDAVEKLSKFKVQGRKVDH